jgi:DNA-binding NarL/FixJ family response regulator
MSLPSPTPIRMVAIEDDQAFLSFLVEAIAPHADLCLVASASTVAQGLALLSGPPADVLLVDLGLPDGSGIDLIAKAVQAWPTCEVLVSTTFRDQLSVIQCFEAGASGYLLKQAHAGRLVEDIRMLHEGGSPISPLIARQVLHRLRPAPNEDAQPSGPAPLDDLQPAAPGSQVVLSAREQEVLEFITKGFTSEEIAGLMGLSRNTVLTYVRRTYRKLNVSSKTEAIYEARLGGLLR